MNVSSSNEMQQSGVKHGRLCNLWILNNKYVVQKYLFPPNKTGHLIYIIKAATPKDSITKNSTSVLANSAMLSWLLTEGSSGFEISKNTVPPICTLGLIQGRWWERTRKGLFSLQPFQQHPLFPGWVSCGLREAASTAHPQTAVAFPTPRWFLSPAQFHVHLSGQVLTGHTKFT